MIISDNTERRSLKLTRCSCRKKAHETENLSAKERWNTKQNLHLSWSFLLPIVKPAIRHSLSFFFVVGLTDSIAIQSISAWKTTIHTHRTLACEFNRPAISLWPIKMAHKNVFDFAAWPFSPVPGRVWVTLPHTMVTALYIWSIIMGYRRNFWTGGCWGRPFQENNKSLERSSNFQYWHMPKFGKWALSPRRMLCFGRRIVSRLYHLAHLFFNG